MSDLINRQAALDALEWKWAGKAAFDAIKELPSVDAVKVIRCRDCRHWRRLWHNKPDGICRLYDISDGELSMKENDYCSKAERIEGNA